MTMSKKQDEKLDTIVEAIDKLQYDVDFLVRAAEWQDKCIRNLYNKYVGEWADRK